ncbi:hypothetical protein LTR23_001434 [Exophiala sp. CCFEE 6169]|uniref:Uncharacterized protein n=1 Tax=Vermiconidia calcicola TaxID=1690605 RepID=A0AAV9Q723_9PEZI|nr:hypothetical protein LTR25_005902 [Vermiconidia calcicola]KAK5548945.1 hypothetical protein LTR23_001434 [Chaetothyriales sp. CCFEE 6169]
MADPLDEEAESWRFQTKELWLLYENDARRANTWQEQNKILIQHLHQHQDRLSPYPWCPSETWLVSWAIKNGDQPMQVFLHWSLLEEEARGGDVTIKMLEEHLKVWADLFQSPRASHFREAVLDEDTPLFCQQQHVGSPWMAHLLVSQPLYKEWTYMQWKKLWQQHLLSKDAMNIDSMGEVPFIYSHEGPQVPVNDSQGANPSFNYHPRAGAAGNPASRGQGGMGKQHDKHPKPSNHHKNTEHVKKPKHRDHASRPKNFVHPHLERFKVNLPGKRKRRG